LAEILERFEANDPVGDQATCVQGLNALHQFALDQGDWKAAWPHSTYIWLAEQSQSHPKEAGLRLRPRRLLQV
jgi:hypothetical protein